MRALLCVALLGLTIPASALAASPGSSAALHERVALSAPDGSVRSFRTGLAYATVEAVTRHRAPGHLELSVDGSRRPLGVTGEHPFWNPGRHRWMPARALALGDLLSTDTGVARIDESTPRPGPVDVYNLDVGDPHNYFVYADRDVVLVHNKDLARLRERLRKGDSLTPQDLGSKPSDFARYGKEPDLFGRIQLVGDELTVNIWRIKRAGESSDLLLLRGLRTLQATAGKLGAKRLRLEGELVHNQQLRDLAVRMSARRGWRFSAAGKDFVVEIDVAP